MRLGGIFSEAFAALRFNRQRSLLTVASLAWGVSCFVILYSYGEGFGTALRTCFQAIGQDLIVVFGGQTSSQAGGERAGRRVRLEFDDVQTIRDNVPLAAAASAELMVRGLTVVRGYRQQNTTIRAVEPPYGRVRNMTMASGRWLAPEDNAARERVAVIGAKAAEKLFGEIPPVGVYVAIGGVQFQIVGLLQTKLQISNYNTPDNQCIFIPYATAGLFKNIKYPDDIVWTPANPIFRDQAVKQVRAVLGRVHSFPSSDERAVEVIVFNEFMKMIDGMALALQVLLGFIGALTLAIGGIGLANIMLVSVTQRTREIGVLKSIGATRGAILGQFLAEAMAIVTVGGLVGVAIAWGATSLMPGLPLLGPIFKDTSGAGDIHLGISGFAVATSTVVLEIVGLVAGLLPAIRASRLNPIEALRYE